MLKQPYSTNKNVCLPQLCVSFRWIASLFCKKHSVTWNSNSSIQWKLYWLAKLFATLIDENADITDLEKFHHLRSSLSEAALATISSLEINGSNYREAISLMKPRFYKILHFQTHIKEIFALKVDENDSAQGLRSLSDNINSHLRALSTMSTKEQFADGFLIYEC